MTARKRLALIGLGKMGRAVAQLAPERGWDVVATIGGAENRDARGVTPSFFQDVDVAIEFTTPDAAPANARAAISVGCPIVVGTTGWHDQLASLSEFLSPIPNVVALQLFAYFVASERGCDVDQPRNLAKSVTVE